MQHCEIVSDWAYDALVDDGKEIGDIVTDEVVTFGREPDVETAAVGAADHPRH